jgi:hypothetical protein
MTAARTVGAAFTIQRYTLTVTAPTHGTVTGLGINCGTGGVDCTETYDYGTAVPLAAAPDTGYDFAGWSGACTGTGACSVTMTAARAVGATFTIQRHTLTVTPPTHGTVTGLGIVCGTGGVDCTETYDYGTVVALTATADLGYNFGGWSGDCTGTGACSVTMTAARTVGASFLERFTLTVTAPAHGTITAAGINCGTGGSDCTETYDYGTVVPLTGTPDAGYRFRAWTGDCTGTGACSATLTANRTVGGAFNRVFTGTKAGGGGYEGPGFVTNEATAAPGEAAPTAAPAEAAEATSPESRPTPAPEPGPALEPAPLTAPNLERAPDAPAPVPGALRVAVSGEVRHPGTYAWFPGMSVRQLVAAAGGLTPAAAAAIELDAPVKAGDTLVVR